MTERSDKPGVWITPEALVARAETAARGAHRNDQAKALLERCKTSVDYGARPANTTSSADNDVLITLGKPCWRHELGQIRIGIRRQSILIGVDGQ